MTFSRANPLGWALFEELTSAQMNIIDVNLSNAIDGLSGGIYNPSAPIVIHGTVEIDDLIADTLTTVNNIFETLTVNVFTDLNGICNMNAAFTINGTTDIFNNVTQFSGEFDFQGTTFKVTNGALFRLGSSSNAQFAGDVDIEASAIVDIFGQMDFESGSNNNFRSGSDTDVSVGADWTFANRPDFQDGLQIDAADAIHYDGVAVWSIRWGFARAFPQALTEIYNYDESARRWRQIDNPTWPDRLWSQPPSLLGDVPVDITLFRAYVSGSGLSGAPKPNNNTAFSLYISGSFTGLGPTVIKDAIDETPNSNTIREVTWTGTTPYNPNSEHLMVAFAGYDGGDTLSGSVVYAIHSARLRFETDRKGIY